MRRQHYTDFSKNCISALAGIGLTVAVFSSLSIISQRAPADKNVRPVMVVQLVKTGKSPAKDKPPQSVPEKKNKTLKKNVATRQAPPPKHSTKKEAAKKKAVGQKAAEERAIKQVESRFEEQSAASRKNNLPVPVPIFKLSSVPRFLHKETPVYPENMKRLGRTDTVKVEALIDRTGKVCSVTIIESAGDEFDKAAKEALMKSTFMPGEVEGKPVAVLLRLPVRFRLL